MLSLAASSEGELNWGAVGPVGMVRPVPDDPISALQVEERTQLLADGTAKTDVLTCRVYRDSFGRVRMEWRLAHSSGRSTEVVYLLDPTTHSVTFLLPERKSAERDVVPASRDFDVRLPATWRSLPKGKWNEQALGARVIEGMETQGLRAQATDERSAEVASIEKWSSASGVTVQEKFLCSTWSHTLELQNLKRGEPDPGLFVVPADYTYKGQ